MSEDEEFEGEVQTLFVNTVEPHSSLSTVQSSQEELEIFDPMPYAFVLKDALRRPLSIPPSKLYHAQITCPAFFTLLDHTVAVLWCFYSKTGHQKLGTAQIHWTIQFLDGLHDARYTKDVAMAIEDLENALLDMSAAQPDETVMNRVYEEFSESVRPYEPQSQYGKPDNAGSFADLSLAFKTTDGAESPYVVPYSMNGDLLNSGFNPIESALTSTPYTHKTISIIINDLLENDPHILADIINSSKDGCPRISSEHELDANKVPGVCISEDILTKRNNLIEITIRQLQEIRNLDLASAKNSKCQANDESEVIVQDVPE